MAGFLPLSRQIRKRRGADDGREAADETDADLVIATDPDCDRMGIAARDAEGKMTLLTGNQIGSLMASLVPRREALRKGHPGHDSNKSHGVVVKNFVTTDLQKTIAEKSGIRCVETLTGFKYIGREAAQGTRRRFLPSSEITTPTCQRTPHASCACSILPFMCLGVRKATVTAAQTSCATKTGDSAAVMIAGGRLAKSEGTTLVGLLDRIFSEFGFYLERGDSLTMERVGGRRPDQETGRFLCIEAADHNRQGGGQFHDQLRDRDDS